MNPDNNQTNDTEETILTLTRQNQELLKANNELLNTINRREIRQFWFKVVWYMILLGVPLFAYYYLYNAFLGNFTGGDAQSNLNMQMLQEALKLYQGQ
ncbi:hypothetical protein K2P47_00760 [Patescibacteria group bacterium]|nr:hypothetical protein [Patescibacteria group bacterium]